MNHRNSPLARPSVMEAQTLELKALPPLLRYVFLGIDENLHVIIASYFNMQQVQCLLEVLKRFTRAIG